MQPQNTQVFISYKKKDRQTPQIARQIESVLVNQYGYQVFLDIKRIPTAAEWERMIYQEIHRSDVLIVLMDAETADSQWVQREVDVARGANVSILPLAIVDPHQIDILASAEKLAISNLQYSHHFQGSTEDYDTLVLDIERLKKVTRDSQRKWIQETAERWRVRPPIEHNPKYRTFPLDKRLNTGCRVHLAVGDLLRMGYFDVIVNSENNYMQMARYYEYMTLSSQLRRIGSLQRLGRIMEDTVQMELDAQIARLGIGRPIPLTEILVTNAGHEESRLRRQARYIFHACTVTIAGEEAATVVTPVNTVEGIRAVVIKTLNQTLELNREQGLPPLRESAKPPTVPYKPLESIILPIFGTGLGGRSVPEVAPPMALGLYEFLRDNCGDPLFTLKDIHIAVYSVADVAAVESAMENVFATS